MASYQVPQFLDSGDKILGPLNLRQFGYALGGFLLGMLLYTTFVSIAPTAGVLAWIPSVPVFLLAAYLALGKFNGRDSDIYMYKFVLFTIKVRFMTYQREPYVQDLEAKMVDWTANKISKRWQDSVVQNKKSSDNEFLSFADADSQNKASKIRRLGKSLDQNVSNVMMDVERKRLNLEAKENLIKQLQEAKKNKDPQLAAQLAANLATQKPGGNNPKIANQQNFFEAEKIER